MEPNCFLGKLQFKKNVTYENYEMINKYKK